MDTFRVLLSFQPWLDPSYHTQHESDQTGRHHKIKLKKIKKKLKKQLGSFKLEPKSPQQRQDKLNRIAAMIETGIKIT